MSETLRTVHYAVPSETRPGQRSARSRFPFEETLTRLKERIQAEELWLIHEIDPQMLMKRGGFEIPATRQLLFFHPRYLVRLLEQNPGALVEVPLKIAVLELPDGTVMLRHPSVAAAFASYAGLEALGIELEGILERLLTSVVI